MEDFLFNFFSLALAHFVALLSPGVDFFLILRNSSKYGRLEGVITSSGIAVANLVYILLALFGISLIKDNEQVFMIIKILGSSYLLYIGYLLLRSEKKRIFKENLDKQKKKKELIKLFSMGFLSAILNPKNSIFYFSMFSIAIENQTPFFIQIFYCAWMFLAVLFWDIFVVYLVTNQKSKIFLEQYTNSIEKISGLVLLIIALLILFNTL